MKRLPTFIFLGLMLLFHAVKGESFKKQFEELIRIKDTIGQQKLLYKWEKKNGKDPELFIAYFNYYVNRSQSVMLTIGQNPTGMEGFKIMYQDSSIKKPAGYIYDGIYYDSAILSKGLEWIAKGIEKYPNRLDMRFGKTHILGVVKDYENFTNEIIKTIEYSAINKANWTWTNNKKFEDPKNNMLTSIQTYQLQLYKTDNDILLDNMKRIAETILKYYPEHIESLSNIAVGYLIKNKYDKALEPLLKAEKINPKDCIILSNIAYAYKMKGDKNSAIKYYNMILLYGDQQTIENAKKQLEELKNK